MTHERIEYQIRASVGRNEWALHIYYPDKADGKPTISKFNGTREDAAAAACRKIDNWLTQQKWKARVAGQPDT
jgi:hypothetical protein